MQDEIFKSGRDTLLIGIPLLLLLFVCFFRLDELLFRSRKKRVRKPAAGSDARGVRSFHSDPDGKPLAERRRDKERRPR
jgi:hypothetical protein